MHAHRGLAQASRIVIADLVLQHPDGIGIAELVTATWLHENTVRDHVRVLEIEGVIRTAIERRPVRGRPRTLFLPATGDVPNETAQRRIDAAKLHGDLLRRMTPDTATLLPHDAVHQLDALYEHLDDLGLEPEIDEADLRVDMVPCPFHDIIDAHRDAACRVHHELIADVLRRTGGPVEVDELRPLVTPHLCHLRLRIASAAPDPGADAE